MTIGDFDRAAETLYRAAGLDVGEPACPLALARALLGPGNVRTAPLHALPGDAAITKVNGSWRIYLREGTPPRRARFAICHELSHWTLGVDRSERDCDRLAAALIAPRAAFLRAAKACGPRLTKLAALFSASESCMALRLGEVTLDPVALVTRDEVRIRGVVFGWPSEARLREMAVRRAPSWLKKCRLRDDGSRTVLRPEPAFLSA